MSKDQPTHSPAWLYGDRIITRNADGGTSGWTAAEAEKLSRAVIAALYRLATKEGATDVH
jgi:hypothetical protein